MISWAIPESYCFCFDAIEHHSVVAVGMVGCKKGNRLPFLRGYNAMLERIEPDAIICIGNPYPKMDGKLIVVEHTDSRKAVK